LAFNDIEEYHRLRLSIIKKIYMLGHITGYYTLITGRAVSEQYSRGINGLTITIAIHA